MQHRKTTLACLILVQTHETEMRQSKPMNKRDLSERDICSQFMPLKSF
jgi:hypothetical protein